MGVDSPSPVGAIFKGTGLFLGAMLTHYELGLNTNFIPKQVIKQIC